jgi:hypothetical protein
VNFSYEKIDFLLGQVYSLHKNEFQAQMSEIPDKKNFTNQTIELPGGTERTYGQKEVNCSQLGIAFYCHSFPRGGMEKLKGPKTFLSIFSASLTK